MKKIEIVFLEGGGFDVFYEGKNTKLLAFDEMLGTVAQLTMPDTKRCIGYLKTKEQWDELEKRHRQIVEAGSDVVNDFD